MGAFLMILTSISYYVKFIKQFIDPEISYLVYLISFFSGVSLSICLNTGIAYISDVVGK